jgi:predicted ester cyclase
MTRTPSEVVVLFHRSVEQGDWHIVQEIVADEFVFSGPSPKPLDKRSCTSMHKALWAAFPDINFHVEVLSEEGDVVTTNVRITGTHKGVLIPPLPDRFLSIPPSGKAISLDTEFCTYTVRNGQMIKMHVEPNPNGGWPGIFKQLDIEYPY